MKILVGCESSGVLRDAFSRYGHDAWSCDIEPTRSPGQHIRGYLEDVLSDDWDLIVAHPPCTYLAASGMHWTVRGHRDPQLTEDALLLVIRIMEAPCSRIAIENPVGAIGTRIRKADQIIQPWMFGDDASKATCLWLKGLPLLKPTRYARPRIVEGRRRWANQSDSGQNYLLPTDDRWMLRSQTYPGVARAMAEQWGGADHHPDTRRPRKGLVN